MQKHFNFRYFVSINQNKIKDNKYYNSNFSCSFMKNKNYLLKSILKKVNYSNDCSVCQHIGHTQKCLLLLCKARYF